jgi:hypothetical protein
MEPLSHPGRRLSVGGGITRWNRSSLQPLPSLHLVRGERGETAHCPWMMEEAKGSEKPKPELLAVRSSEELDLSWS